MSEQDEYLTASDAWVSFWDAISKWRVACHKVEVAQYETLKMIESGILNLEPRPSVACLLDKRTDAADAVATEYLVVSSRVRDVSLHLATRIRDAERKMEGGTDV